MNVIIKSAVEEKRGPVVSTPYQKAYDFLDRIPYTSFQKLELIKLEKFNTKTKQIAIKALTGTFVVVLEAHNLVDGFSVFENPDDSAPLGNAIKERKLTFLRVNHATKGKTYTIRIHRDELASEGQLSSANISLIHL
ncbi:MAG: hypothetical protein VYD53_12120 [Pseudomonadota bacterium]|jgi:hypothetical protein|nr:hypothetical protein [Pseudomonadota bacterium]